MAMTQYLPTRIPIRVHFARPYDVPVVSREADFFGGDYDELWRVKLTQCSSRFRDSIKTNGVLTPVVLEELHDKVSLIHWNDRLVDTDLRLVEGHHRWALGRALGLEVPYVLLSDVKQAGEKPHRLGHPDLVWADGTRLAG